MENIIIKDCPVIKDVKLNKSVLTELKEAIQSKHTSLINFDTEIFNIKDNIRILNGELLKLESDRKEIEELIVEGNPALASKLIPLNKDISEKKKEIEELKNTVYSMLELKEQQKNKLEKGIYSKFLDSYYLQNEFDENAKKLQLQLYSLLYKAFEITTALKDLEHEYVDSVEHEFRSYKPHRSFIETFPSRSYINNAKDNFINDGHFNAYSYDRIKPFVEALEGFKGNEEISIYK
ncbi:hypothetical protein HMPREF1092_01239 [Clostridium thermobutyricum]|uniref:Uncharacterized protein n=1 Tax=Clostridium thermobutyricum TaxID=29372 RepID=N9Y1H3_9CLOT|nr:hypothetical protein [Clostridium thermobutyricum]ENZ02004.1 hypothetical protein HMPREF1092_01239 [Clostridium thermobutyricum]